MRNPSLPDAIQQYLDYLVRQKSGDGREDGDFGIEQRPPSPYIDPWMDIPPYSYDPIFEDWIRAEQERRLMEMLYDAYYQRP